MEMIVDLIEFAMEIVYSIFEDILEDGKGSKPLRIVLLCFFFLPCIGFLFYLSCQYYTNSMGFTIFFSFIACLLGFIYVRKMYQIIKEEK